MIRNLDTLRRRAASGDGISDSAFIYEGGEFVSGSFSAGPDVLQVSPEQSIAAIAAFVSAHPYDGCGEEVEIEWMGRFVGLVCEHCGEERVLEVVEEHEEDRGET